MTANSALSFGGGIQSLQTGHIHFIMPRAISTMAVHPMPHTLAESLCLRTSQINHKETQSKNQMASRMSDATVSRILRRHGLNRLPRDTRMRKVHTKRYNKQIPGYHIQMDVKFLIFMAERAECCAGSNTPPSTMRHGCGP